MMKSKITVEVDYENGNQPILQIISKNSDDLRDGLIKAFYQKLGNSSWCRIFFKQNNYDPTLSPDDERNFKRIIITPIPQEDLKKEADIMLEQFAMDEKWKTSHMNMLQK